MDDHARLAAIAAVLLGPEPIPVDARQAAQDLHQLCCDLSGCPKDPTDPGFEEWQRETVLPTGKALDPCGAATCIIDYPRTRAFALGVRRAIETARTRFPDRPLRILYAGTGPFATLALLQTPFFSPAEVRFVLVDVHSVSLDHLTKIVTALGLEDYVESMVEADATVWEPSEGPPFQVLITEVMQRALTKEPQLAVTRHLAKFLHPRGCLVPETIDLSLCLLDSGAELSHLTNVLLENDKPEALGRVDLGRVLRVTRTPDRDLTPNEDGRIPLATVRLPDLLETRQELHVLTYITTFDGIELKERDSGLTQPHRIDHRFRLQPGAELTVYYQMGPEPGLHVQLANDEEQGSASRAD